jgi:hypothetical protein
MKIYKIPIQIFEKDLEAKTRKYLVKRKFSLHFKFFLFFFAAILTIGGTYYHDKYDFVQWDKYSETDFEADIKSFDKGGESYAKTVQIYKDKIGKEYEHPNWSSFVEFLITAVIVIGLWFLILAFTENKDMYSYEKMNEKIVYKEPMEILFLKLDFLTKGKKGEDVTGSIYVNSPDSIHLKGEHTLLIKNKKFQTREIVSKDADKIKDVDDYFDFDNLERIEKINTSDRFYQRVSSGEDKMDVYKNLILKMNSKYGIKILNIDCLVLPIWEIEIKNNRSQKRRICIDQHWGNKIDFTNFK